MTTCLQIAKLIVIIVIVLELLFELSLTIIDLKYLKDHTRPKNDTTNLIVNFVVVLLIQLVIISEVVKVEI